MQLVTGLFEGFRISGVDNIPVCKSKDRSQKDVPLRASCTHRWNTGSRHEHELEIVGAETYTIALTPRQYRSHIPRKRGCPPRSQNLIVTLPLLTFLMLNPTVGMVSSLNSPTYRTIKMLSGIGISCSRSIAFRALHQARR